MNTSEHLLRDKGVNAKEVALNPFLFTERMQWTHWLSRLDLARLALNIPGAWVECGVRDGAPLMLYHQLSAILEPTNFKRRIIGFDTFRGFPSKSDFDPIETKTGDAHNSIPLTRMQEWISIRSHDRLVQFGEQIELVIGDAVDTIPKFIESNPQLGISMLVLDFDLYEPTKVALEYFLPRMPKGALVVFDELFDSRWPGETKAFMETINIQSTRLKKHDYDAHTIWFELD